jgi:hypothetical protein
VARLRGLTAAAIVPDSMEAPIVVGHEYVARCTGDFADRPRHRSRRLWHRLSRRRCRSGCALCSQASWRPG